MTAKPWVWHVESHSHSGNPVECRSWESRCPAGSAGCCAAFPVRWERCGCTPSTVALHGSVPPWGVFIAAYVGGRAFHNIQSVHRVCPFHTMFPQGLYHILCRCVIGCFPLPHLFVRLIFSIALPLASSSTSMGYIFANGIAYTFSVSIFVPPSGASMCSVYHASG